MAYVICEPCVGVKDRGCVDVCPVNCIHEGPPRRADGFPDMLFINPSECLD
jgi:ferredoxin